MVLDFRNTNILAPMVRIGTLPTRILALKYGADIVYTEEIVDLKILKSKRVVNDILGTIDYVLDDGTVVFRTCSLEKDRVVFQVGTCDAQRALQVAKMVEKDVAAFDVNMGCPKSFSIMGGMGAALLTQPEKVLQILTTLVQNLSIPVTCKVRILPDLEATLSLCSLIESTGVSALAVHGRTRDERPQHANHNDVIAKIVDVVRTIPVIANGGSSEIQCYEDIDKFRHITRASSVMIARTAEANVSIFRREGLLPKERLIREYLMEAVNYDNHFNNTKYCIQQILGSDQGTTIIGGALLGARDEEQVYELWGVSDYSAQTKAKRATLMQRHSAALLAAPCGSGGVEQVRLYGNTLVKSVTKQGRTTHSADLLFERNRYPASVSPKSILLELSRTHALKLSFQAQCRSTDRLYTAAVHLNEDEYVTTVWHKRRQWAEQAAAALCLRVLGEHDGSVDTGAKDISSTTNRRVEVSSVSSPALLKRTAERCGSLGSDAPLDVSSSCVDEKTAESQKVASDKRLKIGPPAD